MGSCSKRTCISFVKHFYRVDADALFVGALHLIHYSLACQRDSGEWIHSKKTMTEPAAQLNFLWTIGSPAGSMHQKKKKSHFSSLLWPVFHTDCCYQRSRHPHVSICQSDIRLNTVSVSEDSIKKRIRVSWEFCEHCVALNLEFIELSVQAYLKRYTVDTESGVTSEI